MNPDPYNTPANTPANMPANMPSGYPPQAGPYPPQDAFGMPGNNTGGLGSGAYPPQPQFGQPQASYQPPAPAPASTYGPAPQNPYAPPQLAAAPYQPQPMAMAQPGGLQPQPAPAPQMQGQQMPVSPLQNPLMGYNPYPYPGEFDTPSSSGPNKLILGVVVVIVIVGLLFAVLAANGGGGGEQSTTLSPGNNNSSNSGDNNASKDIIPRTDGKLDLSSRIAPSKTLKGQKLQGEPKEQLNLSSGFSFMVTKAEEYEAGAAETEASTEDAAAGGGKRYIAVIVVVGNRTESSNISVSYLDFRLRDGDDEVVTPHISTNEILNNPLASPTELEPGEQLTGKVIFEVAANDSEWIFKHSETYQKTTDNTTFSVEGEVVIEAKPARASGGAAGTQEEGTGQETSEASEATGQ